MILTLDIAFKNIGWAVIDKKEILDYGTLKTEKTTKKNTLVSDDRATRAALLASKLDHIITTYKPDGIIGELPSGSQNATAANLLGWASGVVIGVAAVHNLPCEWISQGDSKKATLGVRAATKEATMQWAKDTYPFTKFPTSKCHFEHIADALAAYHGLNNSTLVRMFG